MTFRKDANYTGGRRARTGGGRGGTIAAGGGLGSLLLIGLFLLFGGNPSDLGQITGGGQGEATGSLEHCEYTEPLLVVFQNTVQSGCGMASAQTGPFYCPADQGAYFDVSFFEQLEQLGGTNAPLAQMYIVAHEFAHHVQQLEGTLSMSNYNDPGADSDAVKVELQADCYAGIWIAHADKGENALLEPITEEQVQGAIDTARAVGDDNIQRRTGGEVRPDLWTHGSSEQRQNALLTGYREGNMAACDTLGVREYNV